MYFIYLLETCQHKTLFFHIKTYLSLYLLCGRRDTILKLPTIIYNCNVIFLLSGIGKENFMKVHILQYPLFRMRERLLLNVLQSEHGL